MPKNTPQNLKVVSVHVPKTAGTTFGNVLQQVYGVEQVFFDYAWNDPALEIKPEIRAVHGHFPASKYKDLPSSVKLIAWIRNPVERLISHYFYWQHIPISKRAGSLHRYVIENNIGLIDFAMIPEIKNHISNLYIDIDISNFFFIGIQEHFEEDFNQISELLGFPKIPLSNKNPNPLEAYQQFKESPKYQDTWNKLADINASDMELYQATLKKREKRSQ